MSRSVFISYSRRESPFVDVLLDALEDEGVNVWVDYHCLVPAKPWLDQILEGICEAGAFLLVVSKDSISSANVELEYKHALEYKKRVILLIFEAVKLPPALQTCEWIDFRSAFGRKKRELLKYLDKPVDQPAPPQNGFRTSLIVWLTFFMSLLTLLLSIPAWWTFYIPALLIPLPIRILQRDFHFYRVRFAVLTLPVVLLLSWAFFSTYPYLNNLFIIPTVISFVSSPLLLFLLASKGIRVWGKPIASAPRFANPYQPEVDTPQPVPFFIEHAPADKKYADAIGKELTNYGHPHVTASTEAKANFVLLSRYKDSTVLDPEKQVVYPILIQDTHIKDEKLQKIQWIDFRHGIRNLDKLAKLLPEPGKLLKALGVAPISGQVLYPRIIQMLDYFFALLAFFSISVWIPLFIELGNEIFQMDNHIAFLITNAVFTVLTMSILFFTRRALIEREGRLASLGWLTASLFWVGVIVFIQSLYIIAMIGGAADTIVAIDNAQDMRGSVSLFMPCSCTLGLMLIGLLSLRNWRDLTRWFPAR